MTSFRFPELPNDNSPDDDPMFQQAGFSELDLDHLLEFDRDGLPELGLEEVGLILVNPPTHLSPPLEATAYLTDDGILYWFQHGTAGEELPIQIDIVTPKGSAGYARMGCFDEGVLTLADLRLMPTYRHRGMGSALLRHIIALAREHNLQRIHGFVVERDLRDTPHLLDWYARHGFTVTLATDEDRTKLFYEDAVALLELAFAG